MNDVVKTALIDMLNHSCQTYDGIYIHGRLTVPDLIKANAIQIEQIKKQCNKCFVVQNHLTAADIANLIVRGNDSKWTLCIDLNVYRNNQQFRFYDCVKFNSNNPLRISKHFQFNRLQSYKFSDILTKSMITHFFREENLRMFKTEHSSLGHLDPTTETASLCDRIATTEVNPIYYHFF